VYPASDSDFQFISGVKKHQQYSLEGISGVNIVDNLEDISQVERSPVHEVVDLGDSGDEDHGGEEEEEEEDDGDFDDNEMRLGTLPMGAEESVMVLDSDSDSNEEEEDEEAYGRGGPVSSYYQQSHAGFRSLPGDTRGGADEPIEIESSSDEEAGGTQNYTNGSQTSQPRGDLQLHKKKSGTNGGCGSKLTELPSVNGGDANLNLSEDSSEDGEEGDKSMFDEKAGEDKTEKGNKEKAVKRKRASELEADEEAKRSSVN